MRRTLCSFAIFFLLPTLAFSQARMHPSMPHPPSAPGDYTFTQFVPASVGGTVTAVNGNLVSFGAGLVVIDVSAATFDRSDGAPVTSGSIKPGDYILAILKTSIVNPGTPLPASVVTIVKLPDVELSGDVTAVDTIAQTLTVLGQTVHVTPQTRFAPVMGGLHVNGLADVHPGDHVTVLATLSNNKLVADFIGVRGAMSAPATSHIHGTVKTTGTDAWIITDDTGKDVTVVVNSQTLLIGSPAFGSTVDVFAMTDSSNRLVALSIVNTTNLIPIPPLLTYHGAVKKITPGTWTVHVDSTNKDVDFLVWAGTKIDKGIATGDRVIVQARKDDFGNTVAYSIYKE